MRSNNLIVVRFGTTRANCVLTKKILATLILCILCTTTVWGQSANAPSLPQLATPSPKATMVDRFGYYPTNLYTGLVDYNGNISSMQWRLDGTTRKYAYSYDPLSRLVSTTFSGGKDAERYNTSYSYDKHGNILSLQRYGKTANSDLGVYGLADNLTMTYNGNQLTNVSDAAVTVTLPESDDFKKGSTANPAYTYGKNGNLMTIDGVTHKYTYAADGRKRKVTQGSTYYFYFNDHLGNVRAVIDGGNRNIQFNHYYPYGLPMAETTDGKQNEQPFCRDRDYLFPFSYSMYK